MLGFAAFPPHSKLTCLSAFISKIGAVFVSPLDFLEWVSVLRILSVCFTYNDGDTRALIMALDSVL